MAWVTGIGLLIVAYLLGATPTGYLVARAVKGIDIREHGSGNTGATNVFRVVGKGPGLAVFAIDLVKGWLAVTGVGWGITLLVGDSVGAIAQAWWVTLAGLLAIVGHSRSIWLNWTGGKSAATGLGVLLAMSWPVGLGAAGIFASVLAVSRIVSLGSMVAAVGAVVLMAVTGQPIPYVLLTIAGSVYVILRHRSNIQRLLAGTEPKVGSRPAIPPSP